MKCVSEQLKVLSKILEWEDFWEKCGKGEAFLSQKTRIDSPFKVKKLTIEIEGDGKALTSKTRIFADGKQLGLIKELKIHADSEQPFTDVELTQGTVSFKKITASEAKGLRSIGRTGIVEMVPEVTDNPINIQWVKNYDGIRG